MVDAEQLLNTGNNIVVSKRKVNKFKQAQKLHAEIIKNKNKRIEERLKGEKSGTEQMVQKKKQLTQ